jgi:hypothetical protein
MSNSDRWRGVGGILFAAFLTTGFVAASYHMYMLKRTGKVYGIRMMVLNNAPDLYERLPSYSEMLEKIGGCKLENYFTPEEVARIKCEA